MMIEGTHRPTTNEMLEKIPDKYRIVQHQSGNYSVQEEQTIISFWGKNKTKWVDLTRADLGYTFDRMKKEFPISVDAIEALYTFIIDEENKVEYPRVIYTGGRRKVESGIDKKETELQ